METSAAAAVTCIDIFMLSARREHWSILSSLIRWRIHPTFRLLGADFGQN